MMDWHSILIGILFAWLAWHEMRMQVAAAFLRTVGARIGRVIEMMEQDGKR